MMRDGVFMVFLKFSRKRLNRRAAEALAVVRLECRLGQELRTVDPAPSAVNKRRQRRDQARALPPTTIPVARNRPRVY